MKTTTFLYIIVCCASLSAGMQTKDGRHIFKSSKPDNILDVTDFSIYYDVETNETIRKMMPRPWYKPGWLLRFPFRGGRCNCESLKCTCCTGVRIPAFNFDRRTCAILTYEPEDTMIQLEVRMNNETVYRENYSEGNGLYCYIFANGRHLLGNNRCQNMNRHKFLKHRAKLGHPARNPPPFCVPIPVPYLPPGLVDMCIRLFDINIIDQKLHVCMDMDTRIDKAPVVVLHFDCMDMGFGGVGLSKPSGSATNTVSEATATAEPTQVAYDIYDPVIESSAIITPIFNNTVKYI